MGTMVWIAVTTLIGYSISHFGFPDSSIQNLDLILSFAGFMFGAITRILAAVGAGEALGAFFEIIGDIGTSLLD